MLREENKSPPCLPAPPPGCPAPLLPFRKGSSTNWLRGSPLKAAFYSCRFLNDELGTPGLVPSLKISGTLHKRENTDEYILKMAGEEIVKEF